VKYTKQGLCLAYGGALVIGIAFGAVQAVAALVGLVMLLHGCILCIWGASE
jgi:hypothetical protein